MAYNPVPKLTNSNALFGNDLNVSGVSTFDAAIKTPLKDGVDGATITFNMDESNNHSVTLGGNRTLDVSNVDAGQKFTIRLKQDGTGSRTVSWWSGITWFTSAGAAPTLKTDPDTIDYIGFICTSGGYYEGFHLTESSSGGGGTASITVEEVDGTPSVSNVTTIRVTNGSLTDDGGGTVTIATSGGGGGGSYNNWNISDGLNPPDDITSNETVYISGVSGVNTTYSSNLLQISANIPTGGLENQILYKVSDSSDELAWIDNYATELRELVKNDSGSGILKGSGVMAVGAVGDRIRVAPAIADGSVEARYMLGIASEDIPNATEGYVTLVGPIKGISTSGYPVGTVLWLDPNNAGGLTSTQPTSPNLQMSVAIVTASHASNGRMFVRMWEQQPGLHELHDVDVDSGLTSGDLISYNSSNGTWINIQNPSGVLQSQINSNDNDITYLSGIAVYGSGHTLQTITSAGATTDNAITINNSIYATSGDFEYINLTSSTETPIFNFKGSGATDTPIRMKVLSSYASASTSGTALAFEGTQGQLFGITDNLSSGTIFSVNDITGLPLIAVDASGDVKLAQFGRDIIAYKPITIQSGVPSNTTDKLYNDGTNLYFDGSLLGYDDTAISGYFEYRSDSADSDISTVSGLLYDDTAISGYFESRVDLADSTATANSGYFESRVDQNAADIIVVSGLTGGGGGATYAAGSGITIDGGNNINVYGGSGNFEYVELTTDNNAVPVFKFLGSGATDTPINLEVRSSLQSATGSGTALLFQGTQGQLFSITDNLSSGTIFNVSDITGLPMLEITASGDVEIGEFAENITIHQPVLISGGVPANTTDKLYNNAGSLYFNGSAVGGGTVQGTDATYDIQPTNEGATAGNTRGESSVDLQTSRSAATQVASGGCSTISGGENNTASANYSTVVGGKNNTASGWGSTVGGCGNTASGARSTIGGGSTSTASGYISTMAGGHANTASGACSAIGGGAANTASATRSTVSGGISNTAGAIEATVGGGGGNTSSGNYTTIGGGKNNTACGYSGTVAGGQNNCAIGTFSSTVGGGQLNKACGSMSTVSGGYNSTAAGTNSTVTGGSLNYTNARHSVVGGHRNIIQSPTNECCSRGSTISGGVGHNSSGGTIDATTGDVTGLITCCNAGCFSTIGGGCRNVATGTYSTISGGGGNTASGLNSTVGGGGANCASGSHSTIGGGSNSIASGSRSTIGGGSNNTASGYIATVAGGYANVASASCSTVGGGLGNRACGVNSTVGGGIGNCALACESTVSGGSSNTAAACKSTVAGGNANYTNARHSVVSGHRNVIVSPTNECCSRGATISGGIGHNSSGGTIDATTGDITGTITCCNAGCFITIGGGCRNISTGIGSTVSGGMGNCSSANQTVVAGGGTNRATGNWASILGGSNSQASNSFTTIGGGYGQTASGGYSTIAGGRSNTSSGNTSFVGGGRNNTASGACSTVAGGGFNGATGTGSVVGGGLNNTSSGYMSTVAGGGHPNGNLRNCACANYSTVSGGLKNHACGEGSVVSGGSSNVANATQVTIAGGYLNVASGTNSTITGGSENYTNARHSVVAGHKNVIVSPTNECCSRGSTISGGIGHNSSGGTIDATTGDVSGTITCCNAGAFSTIGGGCRNVTTGANSTISGGDTNTASGSQSTISGGTGSTASGIWSTVGGGYQNNSSNSSATIGGGSLNIASGNSSTVGGGGRNSASGYRSTVGGGYFGGAGGSYSTVGGGLSNTASGGCSTVSGGNGSTASGNWSTVGGGHGHTASGTVSTIAGGSANTSSNYYSFVGGGKSNTASGGCSTVAGGRANTASALNSTVSGGYINTASGVYSTVSGGMLNTASAYGSTVGGGVRNTASAYCSTVGGGSWNTASASYSTVVGGTRSKSALYGGVAHAAGRFAADGDAQHTVLVARKSTTDATANQVMFLDNSSARLTIPAETTWMFTIKLAAHNDTNNDGGWWYFRGGIARDGAGNTSLIGSVTSEYSVDSNISTATAEVVADDTNDALEIRVTGVASKNIRWVAVADISQVSWGTP